MREILFRGKRADNGEWVQGDLLQNVDCLKIREQEKDIKHIAKSFVVLPETIGQYTGLTDKNGKKIFEGDIVKAQDDVFGSPFCDGITGKVVYEETAFFIEPKDPMESQWLFNECAVYEVIGNIHDNPELLGGEDNENTKVY